jgi:hypothetical protein
MTIVPERVKRFPSRRRAGQAWLQGYPTGGLAAQRPFQINVLAATKLSWPEQPSRPIRTRKPGRGVHSSLCFGPCGSPEQPHASRWRADLRSASHDPRPSKRGSSGSTADRPTPPAVLCDCRHDRQGTSAIPRSSRPFAATGLRWMRRWYSMRRAFGHPLLRSAETGLAAARAGAVDLSSNFRHPAFCSAAAGPAYRSSQCTVWVPSRRSHRAGSVLIQRPPSPLPPPSSVAVSTPAPILQCRPRSSNHGTLCAAPASRPHASEVVPGLAATSTVEPTIASACPKPSARQLPATPRPRPPTNPLDCRRKEPIDSAQFHPAPPRR